MAEDQVLCLLRAFDLIVGRCTRPGDPVISKRLFEEKIRSLDLPVVIYTAETTNELHECLLVPHVGQTGQILPRAGAVPTSFNTRDPLKSALEAGNPTVHSRHHYPWLIPPYAKIVALWGFIVNQLERFVNDRILNALLPELLSIRFFERFCPLMQYVILPKSGNKYRPLFDFDDIPHHRWEEEAASIDAALKEIFVPEVKFLWLERKKGPDKHGFQVYVPNCWFSPSEIVYLINRVEAKCGHRADTGIWTSERHMIRAFGSYRCGSFIDGWMDLELRYNVYERFTAKSICDEVHFVREQCSAERFGSCENHGFNTRDCVLCARDVTQVVLKHTVLFARPSQTAINNKQAFDAASTGTVDEPVAIPLEIVDDRPVTNPFLTCRNFPADYCSVSSFLKRVEAMKRAFPRTHPNGSAFLQQLQQFFFDLETRVKEVSAKSPDQKTFYYLAQDAEGNAKVFECPATHTEIKNKFLSRIRFTVTVSEGAGGLSIALSEMPGFLGSNVKLSKPTKGGQFEVSFEVHELVTRTSIDNCPVHVSWVPFNVLLMPRGHPEFPANTYFPFQPLVRTEEELIMDWSEFCIFTERFKNYLTIIYDNLFRNTTAGYTDEICMDLFMFMWRFLSVRVRYPGGYPKHNFSKPEVILFITGFQASGKGKFTELLEALFGKQHIAMCESMGRQFDNAHNVSRRLFSVFDEFKAGGKNGGSQVNEVMKRMTSKKVPVEEKYQRAREEEVFSTPVFTTNNNSNNPASVPNLDLDDRRVFVIQGERVMEDHVKTLISNILKGQEFVHSLYYFLSMGSENVVQQFVGHRFEHIIRQLHDDARDPMIGNQLNYHSSCRAPFCPEKARMIMGNTSACFKLIFSWLELGINITAGNKALPEYIRDQDSFWDGNWLRCIPLKGTLLTSIYTAFTGAQSNTTSLNWEIFLRDSFCTKNEDLPQIPYDLFVTIPDDDLPPFAIVGNEELKFFWIPSLEMCRENWVRRKHWDTFVFPPVYKPVDHNISYVLVRLANGKDITCAPSYYQGPNQSLMNVSHKDASVECLPGAEQVRYILHNIFAPMISGPYGRTPEMQKRFRDTIMGYVNEEWDSCTEARGRFGASRTALTTRMKRPAPFSPSSQPPSQSQRTPRRGDDTPELDPFASPPLFLVP